MILLAEWVIHHHGNVRRIELFWGDLSYLPPQHAVDLLVVSAFPNDYIPTPTSLIGALNRNGVSVHKLSFDKEKDMRQEFSCWLSRPVGARSFKRILCVESGWRGTPPQLADDLFRAIAPVSVTEVATRSVAMPLIGAGDQGYDAGQILESIVKAAVGWLRRGMPVEVLKIVAYSTEAAEQAKQRFIALRNADSADSQEDSQWDVFLSYSHPDSSVAQHINRSLMSARPGIRIFCDRPALLPGSSWLMQIAEAIDSAHCVVALYTPSYWASVPCKDELTAAYVRRTEGQQCQAFSDLLSECSVTVLFQGASVCGLSGSGSGQALWYMSRNMCNAPEVLSIGLVLQSAAQRIVRACGNST